MPTYNFRHKETGEEKEFVIRMSELPQWKADNPEWEQYITSTPGFSSGGGKDMLSRVPDGFKDRLNSIKKGSGRTNTIKTK